MGDIIAWTILALIILQTFRTVWTWFYRPLPDGYEIRTVDGHRDGGRFAKITPYYLGRPIAEGVYPIGSYRATVINARRKCFAHHRYSVDKSRE